MSVGLQRFTVSGQTDSRNGNVVCIWSMIVWCGSMVGLIDHVGKQEVIPESEYETIQLYASALI